jgi:dihydrofolate reductase
LIFGLYSAALDKRDGNLHLIDAFQICIYPMLEGKGLPLFDALKDRTMFRLMKAKTFGSGAIVLSYETLRK